MKPVLTIVILSFNTKDLLLRCIQSLEKNVGEVNFEVIIVDNGSTDGSIGAIRNLKSQISNLKLLDNKTNLGFAAGNNKARNIAKGKYILFLNSDTEVKSNTLKSTIDYLEKNNEVGAMTCKIVLPDGKFDKDARRNFPTPWVALTHLVLRLDRIFPKTKLFAQYWYGYKSSEEQHEVDVIQGAYFLTRKNILDKVGWFDEDYFLDGEDIDLCWKIKSDGWKIVYFPRATITHIKKASKRKPETKEERKRFVSAGVDSMELFYRKRLLDEYPKVLSVLVIGAIRFLKYLRLLKIYLGL